MAPGKEKNNSSKSTSKLPGCTTTHKDYQTIVDFITEIYLRTGNCTPTQLQTQHPKHYQKFNTDSLKGLIYRTKNKLRNNYNFAAGTATPTKADNKDTKNSANSNLEESSDEEESDDELEASDIDSEENFSSDEEESDSDISMGSGSSSKREQRKKKSSKFQIFLILSSLKISI